VRDCKAQAPVLTALLDRYPRPGPRHRRTDSALWLRGGREEGTARRRAAYIDQVRQTTYGQLKDIPVPLASANLDRFGVSTTPTLVLVDREGVVRLYNPGRMTEEALEPLVRRAIGVARR